LFSNRKDGYGGVLLAISNQLTSTQITNAGTDLDLETNCENVWAKILYEGNKSLYLCTYYRPPSDKAMISSTSGFLFFID
jgi:hypothetical protein